MPSLHANPILTWLVWSAAAFVVALPYHSIIEWTVHRFVLHKRHKWLSFPYELHAVKHHSIFGSDESYHAHDEYAKDHVRFVPRDYILLLLVNVPVYVAVEFLIQRPVLVGFICANLAYTQAFNSLHLRWHVPTGSWIEGTRLFKWMKERHRLHHGNPTKNLNLIIPFGDIVFRTWR